MTTAQPAWRFRCFLSARGEDVIDKWINRLSKKAQANLDRALEHLCVQPKTEWDRPHASPLGNNIYVIRFKDQNRTQHRVGGHFHSSTVYFVMTQPAIEKDDRYEPDNFAKLASEHKNICDSNFNSRTQDCFKLDIHRGEDERAERERQANNGQAH